jgi:hypothetical protein
MATLSFQKCECGIRLRIVQQTDGQHQVYTCRCGSDITLQGTVLRLDFSTHERPFNAYDWIEVLPPTLRRMQLKNAS